MASTESSPDAAMSATESLTDSPPAASESLAESTPAANENSIEVLPVATENSPDAPMAETESLPEALTEVTETSPDALMVGNEISPIQGNDHEITSHEIKEELLSNENEQTQPMLLAGVDEEEQDMDEIGGQTAEDLLPQPDGSVATSVTLIPHIINPSPFSHHNDLATADRYRSALQRIISSPESDAEAWLVVMNECISLYKSQLLPELERRRGSAMTMTTQGGLDAHDMMARNEELEKKLDWVESCYGHLLSYFPYSSNYYVNVIEFLLAMSASPFESLTGGEDDFTFGVKFLQSDKQKLCEAKIDRIFRIALGVTVGLTSVSTEDGGGTSGNVGDQDQDQDAIELLGGMCTSSIDLWILYIRKQSRDAKRKALESHLLPPDSTNPTSLKLTSTGEELVRDLIIGAYETALKNGAAFVIDNSKIWKQYLNYVKSWNLIPTSATEVAITIDHTLHSKQKQLLRSIYQRIIALPMLGLDSLWQAYEGFEKAQSEQLASALIQENMPKYQHARSVYLERNRVYNITELKVGRLATPPADFEFVKEDKGNEDIGGITGAGISGGATGGVPGSLAALSGSAKVSTTSETGDFVNHEEFKAKMKEESIVLEKWRRRCSYERSNPERLTAGELTLRVRQCYKDAVCTFMRHVEVWHQWSTWELLNTGSGVSIASNNSSGPNGKRRNIQYAIAALELAQSHLPDSTLSAYAHAQILEGQGVGNDMIRSGTGTATAGDAAIGVMQNFCNRAGNSLGYLLLQQLVRKYKGIHKARGVFATARRNLRIRNEDMPYDDSSGPVLASSKEIVGRSTIDDQIETSEVGQAVGLQSSSIVGGRMLVVNRSTHSTGKKSSQVSVRLNVSHQKASIRAAGYITWHLYSAHATIEHRLNGSPKIAARIYELGLRKHRSFLSTPQYVLQYASLLLELQDEENLRALLTRAIAACEEGNRSDRESAGTSAIKAREAQRPLWDMMLKFESSASIRSGDFSAVSSIEARRRKALYGPNYEDVAGGDAVGMDESDVGIGMHKSSLSDTLIRTDGYDTSSRIVNGLNRLVDCLEVTGTLGQDEANVALTSIVSMAPGAIWKDDRAGGTSDASFRRRKQFQKESSLFAGLPFAGTLLAGSHTTGAGATGIPTAGKLLSAKDRLALSAQNVAVAAASPEWLRGLIVLLPSTGRSYRGAKPPPHLIEMALLTLRDSTLPLVRPADEASNTVSQIMNNAGSINSAKRRRNYGGGYDGDSSDEENGNIHGGGYGRQFRARQRTRMMGTASLDMGNGAGHNGSSTSSAAVQ